MSDVAKQIEKLRDEIRYHDRKYYVEAAPEIGDREYDQLLERLKKLEAEHPNLITPDSPTQRIGDQPVDELMQVEHRVPMLSIDNTYSVEELRQYGARIAKLLPGEAIEWVVELKIDGVAVSLLYADGLLVRGATRGNGRIGDDITHNIRTLRDVPQRLDGKHLPPVLEVRGEVYMRNSDLVRLNEEQAKQGLPAYANTRNVASGAIRLLDPRISAQRRLRFFCHGTGYVEGLKAKTHMEFLEQMKHFGLFVTPYVECLPSMDAAIEHCEELIEGLHELDFEVDGLVLKVNRFDQRERLGSTSKSPRWLIAYKFEKFEATTKLLDIRVQVGKTGAITPVADLEPVELAGTVVRRASLHNADEIERKDCRVGDIVVVEKAGKVIPHIVRTETHLRKGDLKKFHFPTKCPECHTKLVKDENGVYIRCPNIECPAQVRERMIYFAGRTQMDIEGLGEEIIDQLLRTGLVKNLADFYDLGEAELANLTHASVTKNGDEMQVRLGEKTAQRILASLEDSKKRGLARLLAALGIRHIGVQTARDIAGRVSNIEALQGANLEEIRNIVSEDGVKFSKIKDAAINFYERLHSAEGNELRSRTPEGSAQELKRLLDQIPRSWGVDWGASGGGRKDLLQGRFRSVKELYSASLDDFVETFTKEVIGKSLYDYLHMEFGQELISRLRKAGVNMESIEFHVSNDDAPLKGKVLVVTGTLQKYSRDEIGEIIRLSGGRAASSVSKNTDFLVAGENAGSKLEKARKLNVPVISEEEFEKLLDKK